MRIPPHPHRLIIVTISSNRPIECPKLNTSLPREIMFYVYVLQSLKDFKLYTGYTKNLKKRLEQHNSGKAEATRHRIPFKLIYYEACMNKEDALHREKYLKTAYGKRYIKNRLKCYFLKIGFISRGHHIRPTKIPPHQTQINSDKPKQT